MILATDTKPVSKIVLTGSQGLIGSHLLTFLKNQGFSVVGINEDIRNKERLKPYFKDADLVIHAAAKTKRAKNQEDYHSINVLGTKNVVELCLENNSKLIHLSSTGTDKAYGKSKQESQKLVTDYAINHKLKVIILRLSSIYGKEGNPVKDAIGYPLEDLLEDIESIIKTHDFTHYKLIDYQQRDQSMKNIFFYLSPNKKFDENNGKMAQVQINHSLYFWKPQDIIVVTNFPWEYHGIKSLVVGDEVYCDVLTNGKPMSNKPNVIIHLIKNNLISEINWIHDWDSFQLLPLDLPLLTKDIGFVDYGYKPRIQMGNVFFKPSSLDIFQWISERIQKDRLDEEEVTNKLISENFNNIKGRFEKLNITYNIGMRNTRTLISMADHPIRIAHFPPYEPKYLHKFKKIIPLKLLQKLEKKFSVSSEDIHEPQTQKSFTTPLCEIAFKYGSDKCPQIKHNYTPHYWEIFKDNRNNVKKVLEIGAGNNKIIDTNNTKDYVKEANLYLWRDFFPNAQIYGASFSKEGVLQKDRIETFQCDQYSAQSFLNLLEKTGSDIDLVVDSSSFQPAHQVFTALLLMPLLDKKVIYVIESLQEMWIKEILEAAEYNIEYKITYPKAGWDDRMIVIKHKNN